jgi:uncharacterized lipoprotein YmbA
MRRRGLLAGLAVAGVAGCSPAATDYRLAVVAGPAVGQAGMTVVVRGVSVPGYLDQDGIGRPGGDYQFASYPNDVWAEPLADMLQGVMVQELGQRLPSATVLADGGAIGAPADVVVEMNVLRFDPDAAGKLTLDVQIAVRRGTDNKVWRTVDFSRQMPAGAGAVGIVAAMSALWGQAADETAGLLADDAASG